MASAYDIDPYEETVVPRAAVRFPAALPLPEGFDANDPSTWPKVEGRLEYVNGRLWFMPPCGQDQQRTATDVTGALFVWRASHPEFVVGSNEAGMKLAGDVRGADAAIWRTADVGPSEPGMHRVPPVLAVENAGRDDTMELLRDKARWYLANGVEVVWLISPRPRAVIVLTQDGEVELGCGEKLPEHSSLPGLAPAVDDFFQQLDAR